MEVEEERERGGQTPWVEKYRPQKVEQICYQIDMVAALKGVLTTGNLPHLLLYGPPGTGKTSSILALAKELWGPSQWRQRVLELNASDDRGIKVVRDKVKKFAMNLPPKTKEKGYMSPNYKVIILDEADLMTNDAQSALRRIIEDYASTTRFCIICNYITKIITPLASRCVKYQFKPITHQAQVDRLSSICQAEGITLKDQQTLGTLVQVSEGDLRRSVTLLQSVSILFNREIGSMDIREVSGQIEQEIIQKLLTNTLATKTQEEMMNLVDEFLMQGYSANQLVQGLQEAVLGNNELTEQHKCKVLIGLAETEGQLSKGARDDLQLYHLFSQITNRS